MAVPLQAAHGQVCYALAEQKGRTEWFRPALFMPYALFT